MNQLIQQILSFATPTLLWLDRVGMFAVAAVILLRCCRSLFSSKPEREVWGSLHMSNGGQYALTHWENAIGRAKSCDVRLNVPSVSRSNASICRDDLGTWRLYPIQGAAAVTLNGNELSFPVELTAGDAIGVGGVVLYFFPTQEADEVRQAQQRTKPGRTVSPTATLAWLSLFQILTAVQMIPLLHRETMLAICTAFGGLFGLMWLLYIVYRALRRTAFEAETLAFFLVTLNFAVATAYSPRALMTQFIALVLGLVLFLALSLVLRNLRLAMQMRQPIAIVAVAVLAFNLLFGQLIFGAKNWVSIGAFSLQPSEFVKIAFVLVGAATLDRLFSRRNLIFTLLFSAYCVGCLALMSDFGTALIFFVAFLCIAFLRTGDLASIVMMAAAAAFGGGIILRFKPYVAERFTVWRHVWEYTQSTGYQQSRTMSAIAAGGLFGAGPESGWLKYLGAANTDLVFGVLSEEFGFLLALCAVAALIVLAVFTLRSAANARSSFYTIVSCAAAAMLIFQTALNVLGAVDLLPLTGVTFPFLSVGGSSMAACWALLAYVKGADTRQNASFILRLPKLRGHRNTEDAPDEEGHLAIPTGPDSQDFFADRPDIPVDDIFGQGGDEA